MARLCSEGEAAIEFARDVASGKRPVAVVAARAQARWSIRKSLIFEMPAAKTYMPDITDLTNRTKGMGAAGAANNLGPILGPAVRRLAVLSLLTPLWVMAGVALLNRLFVWRFCRSRRGRAAPTGFATMLSAACSLIPQGVVVQRIVLRPFTLLRLATPFDPAPPYVFAAGIYVLLFVSLGWIKTHGSASRRLNPFAAADPRLIQAVGASKRNGTSASKYATWSSYSAR